MSSTENLLLKRIHETGAVQIWNHEKGPVFWYAASVPGPFYVNTELVIGRELSQKLLVEITNIVATYKDPGLRAAKLNELIVPAWQNNESYQQVIQAMVDKAAQEFEKGAYTAISGGERRDWLFSIPFAAVTGLPHLYLFKDGTSTPALAENTMVLHVADLINNAASYFDLWLPILQRNKYHCAGTICVNTRGENGLNRLKAAHVKTVALNAINLEFFAKSLSNGLITQNVHDEVAKYLDNQTEWARTYLMGNPDLFSVDTIEPKSFPRMQSFFENDPWQLKKQNEEFFNQMNARIQARISREKQ